MKDKLAESRKDVENAVKVANMEEQVSADLKWKVNWLERKVEAADKRALESQETLDDLLSNPRPRVEETDSAILEKEVKRLNKKLVTADKRASAFDKMLEKNKLAPLKKPDELSQTDLGFAEGQDLALLKRDDRRLINKLEEAETRTVEFERMLEHAEKRAAESASLLEDLLSNVPVPSEPSDELFQGDLRRTHSLEHLVGLKLQSSKARSIKIKSEPPPQEPPSRSHPPNAASTDIPQRPK